MHPAIIIEEIERAGGQIIAEGGRLRAGLPKTPHAAHLRSLIVSHRDVIIKWLERGEYTVPIKRAVVRFKLHDGGGGQVIDPDGLQSAVADLVGRFGARLDGADLLDWLADYVRHDPTASTDEASVAAEAAEIVRRAQVANPTPWIPGDLPTI